MYARAYVGVRACRRGGGTVTIDIIKIYYRQSVFPHTTFFSGTHHVCSDPTMPAARVHKHPGGASYGLGVTKNDVQMEVNQTGQEGSGFQQGFTNPVPNHGHPEEYGGVGAADSRDEKMTQPVMLHEDWKPMEKEFLAKALEGVLEKFSVRR